jgi:hypothetical protein
MKRCMYAPRHENCPLCAFEIVEKSDTFCDGEKQIKLIGLNEHTLEDRK